MSVYQRIDRQHKVREYAPILKDEPPAFRCWITIYGRTKMAAADTPDELMNKLSRVLAKEGIDIWAILTKKEKH